MAAMVLRRGHGRELSKEEVLAILLMNEEDGLVLQPANYEHPNIVCSCCGCCCGMLAYQKFLPRPADFWTSNFHAEISADTCAGCGTCADRCQVNAVTLTAKEGKAEIDIGRCIGCGLCIATCPSEAMRLKKKTETVPPPTEEALYDEIMSNRKDAAARFRMLMKASPGVKQ
jgi:formate hydrogenlyase subunit 6/NADH:ubiquinone oxidoreductase subunit I